MLNWKRATCSGRAACPGGIAKLGLHWNESVVFTLQLLTFSLQITAENILHKFNILTVEIVFWIFPLEVTVWLHCSFFFYIIILPSIPIFYFLLCSMIDMFCVSAPPIKSPQILATLLYYYCHHFFIIGELWLSFIFFLIKSLSCERFIITGLNK